MVLNTKEIREKTIKLSCDSGAGHLASSLSTVEFLKVLFESFLQYEINNPKWDGRDRLILSKGHGCYAYYVILNQLGFIPDFELENYYTNESSLKGCLVENSEYMIEASTGSLGHGLPISVGMGKSFKIQRQSNKVICVVGDGEMQEGSNFEALQFALQYQLDNLLLIVDGNKLQAMDMVSDVALSNERLGKVLMSFVDSDNFFSIDGHNEEELYHAINYFYNNKNKKPTIILANTIKGYGLPLIENEIKYHFRCPIEDGYDYTKGLN
jgi:transketolase